MLTGKELGQAIAEAIRLKGVTKTAVAQHFGVKGPSVYDWINHGRIGKQHLAELVAYFSDVVGPEHWGMAAGSIEDDIAPSFARLLTAANIDSRVPMTQSAIARALGVSPGTVVAWRGAGVSQDGAEFAEAKFGVRASWIMYGTGMQLVDLQSQSARLDVDRLAMIMEALDSAAEGVWKGESRSKALLVAALYMDGQVTPDTAAMVARAALNGVLATHRGMRESTVKG